MIDPIPVKVVHIIKGLGRGGAERLLVNTIRQHSRQFEFHVIYFLTFKDQLVAELRTAGATVHLIPAGNPVALALKIPVLLRLIRVLKPDLIHAHLPVSGFMARIASKQTGVPLVYTEHNLPSRYHRLTQLLHRYTIAHAHKILCVSETVRQDLNNQYSVTTKALLLENGIDTVHFAATSFNKVALRQELGIPIDRHVIGTVAVFTRQKRLDRWLEICRNLYSKDPLVSFVLSGHGPLMDKLRDDAQDLLDENVILFTDRTTTPEKWMAAMDIYLMSSDYEGLPLALLEAMSLSLPVVASSVGGIPTVVDDGLNGLLYRPEEVDKAVLHLENLLGDPQFRTKLGAAAREKIVSRFGVHRMIGELEQVYRESLNTNS